MTNIENFKKDSDSILRNIKVNLSESGILDIDQLRSDMEKLSSTQEKQDVFFNFLNIIHLNHNTFSNIVAKNNDIEKVFSDWAYNVLSEDPESELNNDLFISIKNLEIFSGSSIYEIFKDQVFIDPVLLFRDLLKEQSFEKKLMSSNEVFDIILNNKNIEAHKAADIFSHHFSENIEKNKIKQLLSQIDYTSGGGVLSKIIAHNNKKNNINLEVDQIKLLLFNVINKSGESPAEIIGEYILKNDSQNLNLDNDFLTQIALNQPSSTFKSSKDKNLLLYNSLLVNNNTCACAFAHYSNLFKKESNELSPFDLAVERKNNIFIKYCFKKNLIDNKTYTSHIDLNIFEIDSNVSKKVVDLTKEIPVFRQSAYKTVATLFDKMDNNDMTPRDLEDFILSINSNSIQNKIIQSILVDEFEDAVYSLEREKLHFLCYDLIIDLKECEVDTLFSSIMETRFESNNLDFFFIEEEENSIPLLGHEKNEMLRKLDSEKLKCFVSNCREDNLLINYTQSDFKDFIDHYKKITSEYIPSKYMRYIIHNNENFHYNNGDILWLCQQFDMLSDSEKTGFSIKAIEQALILKSIAKNNKEKELHVPANDLIKIFNLLKNNYLEKIVGESALSVFISNNESQELGLDLEDLKYVVDNTDINITNLKSGKNCAMEALFFGYEELAFYMVEKGINYSKENKAILNFDITEENSETFSLMEQAFILKRNNFINLCKENGYCLEEIDTLSQIIENNENMEEESIINRIIESKQLAERNKKVLSLFT